VRNFGTRRTALALAVGAACATTAAAHAQLPVAAPDVPTLPDVGGVVPGVVDDALGRVIDGGGVLPDTTLDQLLQVFVLDGGGVPVPAAGGAPIIDTAAPAVRWTVAGRLPGIRRTGVLRVRITSSEPSVVAVNGAITPGRALKGRRSAHSRKLIRLPGTALVFRRAGTLRLIVKLGRPARRRLATARDAQIRIAMVAADVQRNQISRVQKRTIRR
jgi:hypothetical protein